MLLDFMHSNNSSEKHTNEVAKYLKNLDFIDEIEKELDSWVDGLLDCCK